jgi:hypothetical protein
MIQNNSMNVRRWHYSRSLFSSTMWSCLWWSQLIWNTVSKPCICSGHCMHPMTPASKSRNYFPTQNSRSSVFSPSSHACSLSRCLRWRFGVWATFGQPRSHLTSSSINQLGSFCKLLQSLVEFSTKTFFSNVFTVSATWLPSAPSSLAKNL